MQQSVTKIQGKTGASFLQVSYKLVGRTPKSSTIYANPRLKLDFNFEKLPNVLECWPKAMHKSAFSCF